MPGVWERGGGDLFHDSIWKRLYMGFLTGTHDSEGHS